MTLLTRAVINEWFDARMGLATGVASAGSGVGQFLLAPVLVWSLASLGLMETFLVMAAITGAGVLIGTAFSVPDNHNNNRVKQVVRLHDSLNVN